MTEQIRILSRQVLSEEWGRLTRVTFDYRHRDGRWETQVREIYDRGDAAAVLPYDAARGAVLLVRQFRLAAYLSGHTEPLIEACAGMLDHDDPETCVRREAVEELGYRLTRVQRVFEAFGSPGAMTERVTLFVAPYTPADRIGAGGGVGDEDIEVLEMSLDAALAMIATGEIVDAKAIMLLQHVKLNGLT